MKSGGYSLTKWLSVFMAIAGMMTFATPTVTDVVAKQRYPWNGLVDITCKVTGINGTTNGLEFVVAVVMPDSNTDRKVSNFWVVQNGMKSTDLAVHTNGNYRLLWDAQAELGQKTYDRVVMWVTLNAHGKIQLWEGGPYWAETNIGAEEPWEYGYYFWWGDTIGYKRENNAWMASDGSSSDFSFDSSSPTYKKSIATLKSEGWITAGKVLAPEHDAAHVQWGGKWRIPTAGEIIDLRTKCDWVWTTMNGVKGYRVSGKGDYSSASIFLPCAGYGYGRTFYDTTPYGHYWSSLPRDEDDYSYASYSLFFSSSEYDLDYDSRADGQSVRPVQGFTE